MKTGPKVERYGLPVNGHFGSMVVGSGTVAFLKGVKSSLTCIDEEPRFTNLLPKKGFVGGCIGKTVSLFFSKQDQDANAIHQIQGSPVRGYAIGCNPSLLRWKNSEDNGGEEGFAAKNSQV